MTYSIGFGRYGPAEGVLVGTSTGGLPYDTGSPPPIFYGDLVITSLQTSSVVVQDPAGHQTAEVTLSWSTPSAGFDERLLNQVGSYYVSFATGTGSYTPEAVVFAPETVLAGLPVGLPIVVRVRAKTNAGAYGPYHSAALITAYDTAPPPTPSPPGLYGTVRGVQATWDGTFEGGAARPTDLLYIQVEYSATVGFDSVIKGGTLAAAGTSVASLAFGNSPFRAYARLRAVDRAGNVSAPSAVVYVDSARIAALDLDDHAVDSRVLAPSAVQTANVADFALTVVKLKSLQHALY